MVSVSVSDAPIAGDWTGDGETLTVVLVATEGVSAHKEDRAVITPTGKRLTIGTERYATDPIRMPSQRALVNTRHRVPQEDRAVITPPASV